jgi:parallel beta-helix repeat protein
MRLTRELAALLGAALLSLALSSVAYGAKPVTVHCGQVITKDTKLADDLTNCPNDGIVIGADNITLDLNGHTIDGDDVPLEECPANCGTGVHNEGHDRVTIKGGSVREFVDGVLIAEATDNRVRGLSLSDHDHVAIVIGASRATQVEKTSVVRTRFTGIFVGSSTDIQIGKSSVSESALDVSGIGSGILATQSDHVVIEKNAVYNHSGRKGIAIDETSSSNVRNNMVSRNGVGIAIGLGSHDNVVTNNRAVANDGGIGIEDSNDNLVTNNTLHDNAFVGVYVVGSDDNRIEQNSILRNGDGVEAGIHLFSNPDSGDTSDGNAISRNTLEENVGDGILVAANQMQTLIEGNRGNDNTDDGFDIRSASTTVTKNTANRNHDLGIEAVPGVTDGGGNKASGNGNPLQCTNVFCK